MSVPVWMALTSWTAWAPLVDKTPKENDVVAGWTGFAVFMGLVVATVVLLWSFSRQLRRTRASFGVDRNGRPLGQADDLEADDETTATADREPPVRS